MDIKNEKKYSVELISDVKNGNVDRLFELYKQDKKNAYVYFNINGRSSFFKDSVIKFESKDNIILKFKTRKYGISKTKKIYSRETETKAIIISRKGVFVCIKSKIKPVVISQLQYEYSSYKDLILKIIPEIEWVFNYQTEVNSLHSISKKTIKSLIANKLTSFKSAIKFIYKDYNSNEIINMLKMKFKNIEVLNFIEYYNDQIEDKQFFYSFVNKMNEKESVSSLIGCFRDTLNMCKKLDLKFSLKTTPVNLVKKHDELTKEINIISMNLSERKINVNEIFYKIKIDGLELIDNTKRLSIEGQSMSHCVYTYLFSIESSYNPIAIFHIDYQGEGYTMELSNKFTISQLRGFRNKSAPKELEDYLKNELEPFRIDLEKNKNGLKVKELSIEDLPF